MSEIVKAHILLVDDEEDAFFIFQYAFDEWIEKGLLNLSFCTSGSSALELLEKEEGSDISVILSDINMPGMNGFELLEKVKLMRPQMITILISAYSQEEYRHKVEEVGAYSFFEKPVDFDSLQVTLKKLVPSLDDWLNSITVCNY